MQAQLQALQEVQTFLKSQGIDYFVIGGLANAVWGRPRATQDADFKVLPGSLTIDALVALLAEKFQFRVSDPVSFVRQTYVAPIVASNGVGVDIGLAFLPYEEEAFAKAITIELDEISFPACTAEDLIIHKAISEREKDWSDIEGVLIRQGKNLDQAYIRFWLEQFAEALERPQLLARYERLRRRVADN